MSPYVSALHAQVPWQSPRNSPEALLGEPAPRQEARYECARGCVFVVPFAAEAVAPPVWDCHCGSPARLEGSPEGTEASPRLPGYFTAAGRNEPKDTGISPMAQLRKRRSAKDGAVILAEALERVRQTEATL